MESVAERKEPLAVPAPRRARLADLMWSIWCRDVKALVLLAADPTTPCFVGYLGVPEDEAVRAVRRLVRQGRREGRIDAHD